MQKIKSLDLEASKESRKYYFILGSVELILNKFFQSN